MNREVVQDTHWKLKADVGLRWGHLVATEVIQRQSKVLDVGCGNGGFLEHIRKVKDCQTIGLDISKIVVELAKSKGIEAYVMDADGNPLPFEDNQFDYVCAFDVLEHLHHPERALAEMNRIARHLIMVQANPVWWRNRWELLFGHIPRNAAWRTWRHLYYWNYYDLLALLKNYRWQPLKIFYRPGVPLVQRMSYKFAESLARMRPSLFAYAYLLYARKNIDNVSA